MPTRCLADGFTEAELVGLYPEGRFLYYEGPDTDLPAFIEAVHGIGLCVRVNHCKGLDPFATVEVPADRLFDYYALNEARGWAVGS